MPITELQLRGLTIYCHRLTIDMYQENTIGIYFTKDYFKKVWIGTTYFPTSSTTRIEETETHQVIAKVFSDRNSTQILKKRYSRGILELVYLRIIRICI